MQAVVRIPAPVVRPVVAAVGAVGVAAATIGPLVSGPTICPFAIVTDHACPLCGGTRALAALVRGDVTEAWLMHPIIFLVVPLLAWAAGVWASNGRLGRPTATTTNRIVTVLGALTLVIWIVRLISGTLPPI